MIEDLNLDPLPDLPDELAELDAELRDIRMAERSSFGPELRAELERAWREGPEPENEAPGTRRALAASIATVLFAGMLVPSARAAITEITRESLRFLGVAEQPAPASGTAMGPASPLGRTLQLSLLPDGDGFDLADDDRSGSTGSEPSSSQPDGGTASQPTELPRFEPVESTMPQLLDRNADQEAIRRYYPPNLEEQGIGGSVSVRLWVDSAGMADDITVVGGSGYPEMDEAAVLAARELRFRPATRGGRAVGTLVEFEMTFEPRPSPRRVQPVERPHLPEELDADVTSFWPDAAAVPAPYQLEARQLLRAALGRPADLEQRFGSAEHLLAGEPPPDVSPLRWRATASAALEDALARDPENPAPYLALGRIRKRQGLRADALALFEKGAARAAGGSRRVSPRLVAELNYERGLVLKGDWLGVRHLGRLPPELLAEAPCAAGRGGASLVDDLVGMNYLCPEETQRLMEEGFRPVDTGPRTRERMLEAFRAAVGADPTHVEATVELLLARADDGRWADVLNGARTFAWASRGHPYALLLSGLALQRLGRSDEAMADFDLALDALPEAETRRLRDLAPLIATGQGRDVAAADDGTSDSPGAAFWRTRDPIRLTEVNEREVEHLARTTWALLALGGPQTEAGEVWVRYGRPAAVRAFGEGTGLRTEFWDFGRGPDLTFRRPAESSEPALTSEARAYLSDLGAILPHWYGRQSRTVTTLPAQVGRFRGRGGEPAHVTVHARLPEEMATGAAESVELGLFMVGADGEVLSGRRRSLPAEAADVRMDAPVPDRADHFVLELYHAATGRAAAVEAPVARDRSEGEDPRISDLLVTDPARPLTRAIHRDEPWIIPRAGRDASGERVGVLFELYGTGPDAEPYRLSAEIEPPDGGDPVQVPIRPAGEDRFGTEWPRPPLEAPEFLTLDLSGVGPGTYTLRVVVDGPGFAGSVVAERTIER